MSFSRPEGDRNESWGLGVYFLRNFFSLSSLHFSPKNTSKNLRFNLSLNNQKVVFLLSIFLSLVLYLGFEAQGCGCIFLATIYTHCFSSHGCSFILLPSMFYGFFQHVSLLFTLIYHFDVVGLTLLGQDFSKFNVCAQIHILLGSLPCLCLDLHVYVLFALFILRSTCLCVLCHVYAQIYMFMLRSMCLCLDLYVYVLRAMFVCLNLYVGC